MSSDLPFLSRTTYPSIVARFAEIAARHGPERALVHGDASLTYAELARRSDRIAAGLGAAGVKPGSGVGVSGAHSLDLVCALLGILKAGAHSTYLDAAQPRSVIERSVRALGLTLVLGDERSGPLDLPAGTRFLTVADCAQTTLAAPAPVVSPDAVAYVVFSSGTTGEPRAIACTHRGVTRLVLDQEYLPFHERPRFLAHSPLSFDASTLELWGPLLSGGLCVLHAGRRLLPEDVRAYVRVHALNALWLTSALFNAFVDLDVGCFAGLETVLSGGDVLSVTHVAHAMLENPAVRFVNGYGPTENTTFTCCHVVRPGDLAGAALPIGRPIHGTGVALCDPALRPVARGQVGELVTYGAGLAQGYLGNPTKTAERFREIVLDEVCRRVYLTGDLARQNREGLLEFLGRRDSEVKINGFRVDTGEVEHALRGLPDLRDCAVLAIETSAGAKSLVCFHCPPLSPTGSEALRRAVTALLPSHLVPSAFVPVPSLPTTTNGKVDRAALVQRWRAAGATPSVPAALAGPQFEAQRFCAALWTKYLGRPFGGEEADDFFLGGGDSLLALRLVSALNRSGALSRPLGVDELYANSTLARLAAVIEASVSAGGLPWDLVRRSPPIVVI
jgi:amino acid adenylation domain-containing protein